MRRLVVTATWGIANRINAILNGVILAKANDCGLVINWLMTEHCQARFEELFSAESDWAQILGVKDITVVHNGALQGMLLAQTLFCPPLNRVTRNVHSLMKNVAFETYSRQYAEGWQNLPWKAQIVDAAEELETPIAFHARTQWSNWSYIPVKDDEIEFMGKEPIFIACDSAKWIDWYRSKLPKIVTRNSKLGQHDLECRDSTAILDAAVEMIALSKAKRLFVHAPIESTFILPVIFGAKTPTLRFTWWSSKPEFMPD